MKEFFNQLAVGNASVITVSNIGKLNQRALELYEKEELTKEEIEDLKYIIMSCNILYNRTDMNILPVEDGFYDLLLEKYKKYDAHFQVGSAVVDFKNFISNDIENPQEIATSPIAFVDNHIERNDVRKYMYNDIMRVGKPKLNQYDYSTRPIEFDNSYISKRSHNTKHNHPSLVGTLDKAKFVLNKDAIEAGVFDDDNVKVLERDFFQEHIKKGIIDPNQKITIVAELKYDGISVEADCNLEVQSARTRGDTGIGEASDITPILRGYTFKQAKAMIGQDPIGVKFEAIITKSNLYKFSQLRGRNYVNGRTAIVGLFGASDAYLFRDLITLVPLAIDRDDVPQIKDRISEIEFINRLFVSHGEPLRYSVFNGTVAEVLYMIKAFWEEAKIARDYLDFMYDGIVISYVDEDIRNRLGRKNYINKYSMAVKFDAEEKQTIFRGYTYEVGQHGQITPMIHYDPVEFIGTIHTKSTGSSYDRFQKLGLKYGDFINVKYMNDVMPYVSKMECEHNRNNPNKLEEFPKVCPVCGSPVALSTSGDTAFCTNQECPARSVKRMTNMMSKLNIKGFAEAAFKAMPEMDHLYKLYQVQNPLEYYCNILGTANGTNFVDTLNRLTVDPIKDYIAIGALGFTSIAHKKWKSILGYIRLVDLYTMYVKSKNETDFLLALKGAIPKIGDITARTIAREFKFFDYDIALIITWNIIDSYGQNEAKMQIRFSGCRNKQLCELLTNAGYDADDDSSVTSKTDLLVIPFNGFMSNKVRKAQANKCVIVTKDEFESNPSKYLGEQITIS